MPGEEEWINIGISISVSKAKAPEMEKLLKPYADELKWQISSKGESEEKSQILINPQSGHISPEDLNKQINKIAGVSFGILKDIAYLGDREKALQNHMHGFVITSAILPKTKREIFFLGHTIGFLWFNYDISKRLALEKGNPELALSLFFNKTVEGEVREFFQKKQPKENDAELKSKLEELYGFKLN